MNNKNGRLKELDALRGIASILVVLFHFTLGRPGGPLWFKLGTTGVDLFFIISGFVILMSLEKITKSTEFIINRISRLYPTYWISVTFTFLLILVYGFYKNGEFSKTLIVNYLSNLTMFQFFMNVPNLDGPYWTMIIEMLFYVFMLFLFHFKLLKYLNIFGIIFSFFAVFSTALYGDASLVKTVIFRFPLFQFIPLFLAGSIFYKIYTYRIKLIESYFLILFCLISQILLFKHAGRSSSFINHTEYSFMLVVYFLLFTLFVNNKLGFIVSKWTLFLGKISFALYLIHQYISTEFIIPFLVNRLNVNFWVASLLIALPISIILATFITFKLELKLSKLLKKNLSVLWLDKIENINKLIN